MYANTQKWTRKMPTKRNNFETYTDTNITLFVYYVCFMFSSTKGGKYFSQVKLKHFHCFCWYNFPEHSARRIHFSESFYCSLTLFGDEFRSNGENLIWTLNGGVEAIHNQPQAVQCINSYYFGIYMYVCVCACFGTWQHPWIYSLLRESVSR